MAACATVGPDYQTPEPAVAAAWSAPTPHGGQVAALTGWWAQFGDPVLTTLQQAAERDSPTLAIAWGNIEAARATLSSARAAGSPSVTGSGSVSRGRDQTGVTATTRAAGADLSWALDPLGQQRRSVDAADATLAARRDDWHDARVTLAAEVATRYVEYRACTQLVAVYEEERSSVTQTAQATAAMVRAGLTATKDGALTDAAQASTTASLLAQRAECQLLVTTLANLTGLDDTSLRSTLAGGTSAIPTAPALVVDAVPAQTVRQRADVASRERALASASEGIGVAVADLYPSLKLAGSIQVSAASATSLTTWSFGPSLTIPLFDGGTRRAAVASARANYEIAYAQWRDAVRAAVTEVERAMVTLDGLDLRVEQVERSAAQYRAYLVGSEAEQRAGTISLLTFEEARRQALAAQLELIGVQRDRVSAWITLYAALGGGWDPESPVTAPLSRAP